MKNKEYAMQNRIKNKFSQIQARLRSSAFNFAKILFFLPSLSFADQIITSETTTMENDTYILESNITISSRITVVGTVTLYLKESYTLTATSGISVLDGNTLIIEGTGRLSATGTEGNAGIGVGSSILTINGGIITATGGSYAAGIGGGKLGSLSGTLTINGGTVTATGKNAAAGIGGGDGTTWAGSFGGANAIIINGGTVIATSAGKGSAIGGSGGTGVTVTGGFCNRLEINGGKIYAKSGSGWALGAGYANDSISGPAGTIIINWSNLDDYLDTSESARGLYYSELYIEKDFRYASTGDDGMTVTAVTKSNIDKQKIVPLKYYTVTFVSGNTYLGESDSTKTFYGSKLAEPVYTKSGYTFACWCKNRSLTTEWHFDTDTVEDDTTLYAKWISDEIKASCDDFYDYNDGNAVSVTPAVTSSDGSLTLKAGSDYTVSFKKITTDSDGNESTAVVSEITAAGKYRAVITGSGDYNGKKCESNNFVIIQNLSGSGTEEDPYIISSLSDWALIETNLASGISYEGKYFSLSSDMELTTSLCTAGHPFDGILLGNGFAITACDGSDLSYIFSAIKNATIKNLYTTLTGIAETEEGENTFTSVKLVYTEQKEGINKVITSSGGQTFYLTGLNVENLEEVYLISDFENAIDPVFTLDGETLSYGRDFTVSFINTVTGDAVSRITTYGEYRAIFEGCGSYVGEYTHDFKIPIDKNAVLSVDENGEYFINLPADGSILDFDATDFEKGFTFKIYDDGGKGGGYFSGMAGNFSANASGFLRIRVKEGYLLQFTGFVATKNKYNYLTIYSGSTVSTNDSDIICNKAHAENTENDYISNLATMDTKTNSALVYFKGTNSTSQGFEIEATIISTKTLTANEDPYTEGSYYTTFYSEEGNYLVESDCEIFYARKNADGKIILEQPRTSIILRGKGVILKSSKETITLYETNMTDDYDSLLSGTTEAVEAFDEDVYILSCSQKGGVGFYKWKGSLEANKAYYRSEE
ncbi:MAG: InlB B-repeat-containing protein [Treponema sp.]|nr:InlB B-repeat-containing protein [Treponema sp.]